MREALVPLTFEKGLADDLEDSVAPAGTARVLANWEPVGRSLRARRGWGSSSIDGLPAVRGARGFGTYVFNGTRYWLSANDQGIPTDTPGQGYRILALDRDQLGAGTWITVEDVSAGDSRERPVSFAAGAGVVLYCTPNFPNARIRRWDGTTAAEVETTGVAGRCLAYHLNYFFTGGSLAEPTFLRWAELGDPTNWNPTENFQPIGKDDGEPLEALGIWDSGLVIGKESGVWFMTGDGPSTFAWHPLDGGGCAPGRTIVPTPFGVCVIGRTQVFMWSGAGVEPISAPILGSYQMTGDYMTGAYVDGRVFVTDHGSAMTWSYDLIGKTWKTEPAGSVTEGPAEIWSQGQYLVGGAKAAAANSILLYRLEPGGARERDAGMAETLQAATPQLWLGEAAAPTTILGLYVKVRQRGGNSFGAPLVFTVTTDDPELEAPDPLVISPRDVDTPAVFRERLSCGATGYGIQVAVAQELTSTQTDLMDVEEIDAIVQVSEPR